MAHSGKDVDVTRVGSRNAACEICVKDTMLIAAGEIIVAGKNDPSYLHSKGLNHQDRSVELERLERDDSSVDQLVTTTESKRGVGIYAYSTSP